MTGIGSKREKTLVDYYYVNYPQVFDGKEHGGYYTQEQIKDVVAYAASKYINVVPEIEMPGHALATCRLSGIVMRLYTDLQSISYLGSIRTGILSE